MVEPQDAAALQQRRTPRTQPETNQDRSRMDATTAPPPTERRKRVRARVRQEPAPVAIRRVHAMHHERPAHARGAFHAPYAPTSNAGPTMVEPQDAAPLRHPPTPPTPHPPNACSRTSRQQAPAPPPPEQATRARQRRPQRDQISSDQDHPEKQQALFDERVAEEGSPGNRGAKRVADQSKTGRPLGTSMGNSLRRSRLAGSVSAWRNSIRLFRLLAEKPCGGSSHDLAIDPRRVPFC